MDQEPPLLRLRVFDLNCWAIRYVSKLRAERIQLIGEFLSEGHYDIILLQEIWSEKDYLCLKKKLCNLYPASHLFKSGVIGSGLCVFSRFPILDTFQYRFSLNGYPYMIQHGDWFCGKSVGLVSLRISGILCNVYVTHLHAEYSREKDSYLPHRVLQTWELAQFINHTSKGADVLILGGDLNMHPMDVGLRLLLGWTGLHDAFVATESFEGSENGCTLLPNNCFTNPKELEPFTHGIRIDYILYKGLSNFTMKCVKLRTTEGTAPGKAIPYSDHEAVMATLHVEQQARPTTTEINPELVNIMNEAQTELMVGLHSAIHQRFSTGRMSILGMLLLLLQIVMGVVSLMWPHTEQAFPKLSYYLLGFVAFTVLLVAGLCHIFHIIEVRLLQEAEEQMRLGTLALQDRLYST